MLLARSMHHKDRWPPALHLHHELAEPYQWFVPGPVPGQGARMHHLHRLKQQRLPLRRHRLSQQSQQGPSIVSCFHCGKHRR